MAHKSLEPQLCNPSENFLGGVGTGSIGVAGVAGQALRPNHWTQRLLLNSELFDCSLAKELTRWRQRRRA